MADFIGIDIQGLEPILAKLKRLPEEAKNLGADEAYEYILNVVRTYAPYRYVSRTQAYGQPFQSDKQRRWFFAALARGEIQIPYRRTQTLRQGWKKIGEGYNAILANETPYAGYVQQRETQSRMHKLIGWDTVEDILEKRIGTIVQKFDAGVKKAIRKLGL